jgi:TolB-like protein/DNA-binding CsgD family transcriptional regulator
LLSKREIDVAEHYASGQSHKEIARKLNVSPSTIRNHIASIYRKLEINNKAQLVHQLGIINNGGIGSSPFASDTVASPALQILDRSQHQPPAMPSIAVLPFKNIGSPNRAYFCQGLSLNIHNNLTRFPDLFVSGRSSCLSVSHLGEDIDEVGLNLGVQYLVRGAARTEGSNARVTVELIDCSTERIVWSEQFDRRLNDILLVETEIANTIAGNLSIRLEGVQYEKRKTLSDNELNAYDWQLRGFRSLELGGRDNLKKASREFKEALKLVPESAAAYAGLSMSYGYECDQLLAEDYDQALRLHVELAEKAILLDESDSRAHYAMLCAYSLKGEFELADQHAIRAVELNPSEYHNLCSRGYTLMSLDNFEQSVDCFNESLRRNPLAPNSCLLALGLMEYLRDNYSQSAIAFSRMLPSYLQKSSSMAASFGQLGYESDAHSAANQFHQYAADRTSYPSGHEGDWNGFWGKIYPHLGRTGFQHLTDGLQKAGLPCN